MRGRLRIGTAAAACAAFGLCGVAHAGASSGDALRAAVFQGGGAASPALAAATPAAPAEPLVKVIIRSADGREETRMLTRAQLDVMTGRAPAPSATPAPPAAVPAPPTRSLAAEVMAARAEAPRRLAVGGRWVALSRTELDAATRVDDDDNTVSPVVVQGVAPAPTTARRKVGRTVLGVRDGRTYRDKGRFYLYAAGKGGGLGLNLVDHGEAGGWGGDGMSYDRGGFAGQRSAGVGWRQGDLSTSLGWVHAKTNLIGTGIFRAPAEKDDRVAFLMSWRPSPR